MRRSFPLFLVAMLLACPAICRAAEDPCCRAGEVGGCLQEPGHPAPGPLDDDSCLCSGAAIKADGGAAGKLTSLLHAPLLALAGATPAPASPALILRLAASDPGGRARPVRLHVLLEIHRC